MCAAGIVQLTLFLSCLPAETEKRLCPPPHMCYNWGRNYYKSIRIELY